MKSDVKFIKDSLGQTVKLGRQETPVLVTHYGEIIRGTITLVTLYPTKVIMSVDVPDGTKRYIKHEKKGLVEFNQLVLV
jgi:hypothetical protein